MCWFCTSTPGLVLIQICDRQPQCKLYFWSRAVPANGNSCPGLSQPGVAYFSASKILCLYWFVLSCVRLLCIINADYIVSVQNGLKNMLADWLTCAKWHFVCVCVLAWMCVCWRECVCVGVCVCVCVCVCVVVGVCVCVCVCVCVLACVCVCVLCCGWCVCVCVLSGLFPAQWVEQRGVDVTLYYDNLFNLFLSLAQQFRFMFRNMFVFSQKSFTFVFPEWRRVLLLCLCVSACLSVSLAPLLLLVIISLVTSIVTSTLPLHFLSLSLHNCLLFGLVVSSCSFVYLFSADRVSKS